MCLHSYKQLDIAQAYLGREAFTKQSRARYGGGLLCHPGNGGFILWAVKQLKGLTLIRFDFRKWTWQSSGDWIGRAGDKRQGAGWSSLLLPRLHRVGGSDRGSGVER